VKPELHSGETSECGAGTSVPAEADSLPPDGPTGAVRYDVAAPHHLYSRFCRSDEGDGRQRRVRHAAQQALPANRRPDGDKRDRGSEKWNGAAQPTRKPRTSPPGH
jgi:hypothetical protein